MVPTIYVVDDSNEATGILYHFCGEWCCKQFQQGEHGLLIGERFVVGKDDRLDLIRAEACANCGDVLEPDDSTNSYPIGTIGAETR
jgi:hypothetical protein